MLSFSERRTTVKLTITFPDNVAKKVRRLPNPDEFVSRVVERALEQGSSPVETLEGRSRWARLAAEIADGSMSLGEEAAARFEHDRKDFREQFQFKHDRDE